MTQDWVKESIGESSPVRTTRNFTESVSNKCRCRGSGGSLGRQGSVGGDDGRWPHELIVNNIERQNLLEWLQSLTFLHGREQQVVHSRVTQQQQQQIVDRPALGTQQHQQQQGQQQQRQQLTWSDYASSKSIFVRAGVHSIQLYLERVKPQISFFVQLWLRVWALMSSSFRRCCRGGFVTAVVVNWWSIGLFQFSAEKSC